LEQWKIKIAYNSAYVETGTSQVLPKLI